ncbi:hypothetical protein GCM10023085_56000 [Actinomadura viridis]
MSPDNRRVIKQREISHLIAGNARGSGRWARIDVYFAVTSPVIYSSRRHPTGRVTWRHEDGGHVRDSCAAGAGRAVRNGGRRAATDRIAFGDGIIRRSRTPRPFSLTRGHEHETDRT